LYELLLEGAVRPVVSGEESSSNLRGRVGLAFESGLLRNSRLAFPENELLPFSASIRSSKSFLRFGLLPEKELPDPPDGRFLNSLSPSSERRLKGLSDAEAERGRKPLSCFGNSLLLPENFCLESNRFPPPVLRSVLSLSLKAPVPLAFLGYSRSPESFPARVELFFPNDLAGLSSIDFFLPFDELPEKKGRECFGFF
jgi:hypothetical protein